jgi:hypothetical protein
MIVMPAAFRFGDLSVNVGEVIGIYIKYLLTKIKSGTQLSYISQETNSS